MSMQLDGLTAAFLASIANCLPRDISGDVMQEWNENPKALSLALRKALCPKFKVWQRVTLGSGPSNFEGFRRAMKDIGMELRQLTLEILKKPEFTTATVQIEVDLVKMSLRELGFEVPTCYDQICARAKEIGLELCPAEVGPQLRLRYIHQRKNERLYIAMEAICGSNGKPEIFCIDYDSHLPALIGVDCLPNSNIWPRYCEFVFVGPKLIVPQI